MTLVELSSRVGVTVANLSILKNSHAKAVRFSTLSAICDALGAPPETSSPWTTDLGRPSATQTDSAGSRQSGCGLRKAFRPNSQSTAPARREPGRCWSWSERFWLSSRR